MRTIIAKIIIGTFCLWHMFAIGIYSLPSNATDKVTKTLREKVRPWVMNYLFITSQWQQWNLFSPDPLRRVTSYVLQIQRGGEWVDYAGINRQNIPWHALSRELKLLYNLEAGGDNLVPVRKALLQTYCRMLELPEGTALRLVYDQYVLPQPPKPLPYSFWRAYKPEISREINVDIRCHIPTASS